WRRSQGRQHTRAGAAGRGQRWRDEGWTWRDGRAIDRLVPKLRPTLTLAVVLASAAAGTVSSHATPACFGAAARDVEHPCVNHRLDFTVTPSPAEDHLPTSHACQA